jgi:hypothetical protein
VSSVSKINIQVLNKSDVVADKNIKIDETIPLDLNENFTLSLTITTTFKSAPKYCVTTLQSGSYSVSFPMNFKDYKLTLAFTPQKLKKLYKKAATYDLEVIISDSSLDLPIFLKPAIVNYITDGEVKDNWTDVEWDFQPKPKTPQKIVVYVFSIVIFIPFAILIFLCTLNGVNFGYFPDSVIDAVLSLAFVVGLGAFLVFFVYFWKALTFEEMFKRLLVILPVLGVLLRCAMIGRAKMVAKSQKTD